MFPLTRPQAAIQQWSKLITFCLALWIGGSLVLDFVVMPSLYEAGMMSMASFASVGFLTFERFNHLELFAAALTLTGVLVMIAQGGLQGQRRSAISRAVILLGIALGYTYFLTPHMSSLGLNLNLFETVEINSPTMNWLHLSYWAIEAVKLSMAGWLLHQCEQPLMPAQTMTTSLKPQSILD